MSALPEVVTEFNRIVAECCEILSVLFEDASLFKDLVLDVQDHEVLMELYEWMFACILDEDADTEDVRLLVCGVQMIRPVLVRRGVLPNASYAQKRL